jgi:rhomboid protease GluP
MGRLDVARLIIAACVIAYAASVLLDPRAALRARGLFDILAPSSGALYALGATGAVAWAEGRWWTLLTAIYLHGSLLHLLFNLMWVRQLAPAVESALGAARLVLVFHVAGAAGFLVSNAVGVHLTIGASGAVFGLLGAMVQYGRSRGGRFGLAVFREYGQWALVIFALGFLMPGVNNAAHAGGFAAGYATARLAGRGAERGVHRLLALAALGLTALSMILALGTAIGR